MDRPETWRLLSLWLYNKLDRHLYAEDAEDDEERAADEDDVADGSQRRQ